MHGELRELIRKNAVLALPMKPDVVLMGHYHIQMALLRAGIPVLFTGHWVSRPFERRPGVISHLGGPELIFGEELKIKFRRGPFTRPGFHPRED